MIQYFLYVSLTIEPSFMYPSRCGPSRIHVSAALAFGSSSGYPRDRLIFSTSSRIRFAHSFRSSIASGCSAREAGTRPNISSLHSALPLFFASASASSRHFFLRSPNVASVSTSLPNETVTFLKARGMNRGNLRVSCMIWSVPSINIGTTSGHSAGSRISRATPHLKYRICMSLV